MNVAPKKRKNMKHLAEMSDYDWARWMEYNFDDQIEASWKLDGFFLRFGKDEEGKFWFQTARSPVMHDPMEVIWHSLSKGYDHNGMTRAENYFHLLTNLQEHPLYQMIPNDCGLECEVFDSKGAVYDKDTDTLRFVNIPYAALFFAEPVTLFVYKMIVASTGEDWIAGFTHDAFPGMGAYGTRFTIDVDFSYFQNAVASLSEAAIDSLKSMKHKDRELKLATKEKIAILKQQFNTYILSRVNPLMGENFEGVVIWINNSEYKITTPYFRQLIMFKELLGG